MAISQPVPEILPGWTVSRGTPADQAILQGAVGRIRDEFGGLRAALKRNISLKKQLCRQDRRRLVHSSTTWETECLL